MPNPFSSAELYRRMRGLNRRLGSLIGRGKGPARRVLVLTTTGRKSGQPRQTPLQFEELDGWYYVGSARGCQADWYRNLQADPHVQVQVGQKRFAALAEAVTETARIADFFALRLQRSPWGIGLLMRLEGLPLRYSRADLERFAEQKALVILRPQS